LAVNINGNRGAKQEISVSTKVSKEIVPLFQQEFPIYECDVKNDLIGHPESDKNVPLRMLLGTRLRLHPKTSDSL